MVKFLNSTFFFFKFQLNVLLHVLRRRASHQAIHGKKKFLFSSRYLNHEKWLELRIWIEFRFDSVSFDSRRLGVTPPQITNQGRFQNQGKVRGGVARWWFIRSLWLLSQKIKYPPRSIPPRCPWNQPTDLSIHSI